MTQLFSYIEKSKAEAKMTNMAQKTLWDCMDYEWICLHEGCQIRFHRTLTAEMLSRVADQVYELQICSNKRFMLLDFKDTAAVDEPVITVFAAFLAALSNEYDADDFKLLIVAGREYHKFVSDLKFYMGAFNGRWVVERFDSADLAMEFVGHSSADQPVRCKVFSPVTVSLPLT